MSVFLAKSLMSRRKCSKVATQNGKIMENWVEFCKWFLSQLYDSPKKVRSEMACAAWGAQCKERPDAGAMGSQDEVECKRQGDLKVMAWWGLVDGRMLEVRWMVDENGRPQSVSGYVTTVCIAGRPLESLVYARWSSVLHNRPQHQLFQSQISSKSVLPFDRR